MTEKLTLVIATFLVSWTLISFYATYMHEHAHVQINEHHGFDSEIVFNLPVSVGTMPLDVNAANYDRYLKTKQYHLLNEIIGYNMSQISYALLFAALIISVAINGRSK